MNKWLLHSQFNKNQKIGATSLDGPVLILAGAGSGKTKVLTYRIVNLILQKKTSPEKILAVTFTNKAALEMKRRALNLLKEQGISVHENPPWIGTFHSLGAYILRRHIDRLHYKTSFNICDSGEQLQMIKRLLYQMNMSYEIFPPKRLQNQINKVKRLGLLPHQVYQSRLVVYDQHTIAFYKAYEEEMKQSQLLDFADLLFKTYILFKKHPDILALYRNLFAFIHVDEYQDTNHIQYLILKILASQHKNICVVGDEDQSIYGWRGADIQNILRFEEDYPEAQVIKLEENYRSTQNIIQAASKVIANNKERKNKILFSNKEKGDKVIVQQEINEKAEAKRVILEIREQMKRTNAKWSDFAVFYRTHAQSRVLEEQFLSEQIPHKLLGGTKFYDRREIKDILFYLRFLVNHNENIAFLRIINTPARGIGKTTLSKIESLAHEYQIPLVEAAEIAVSKNLLPAPALKKFSSFLSLMSYLREESQTLSLSHIYKLVLEKTSYIQRLKATEERNEAEMRIGNLEELHTAMRQFESDKKEKATIEAFLERTTLMSEIDNKEETTNYVTLMTLHVSKGLEFPYVFIVGMEEGLFPTASALDRFDSSNSLEEERRLAYVGMTRAKEKLYLLCAKERNFAYKRNYPTPSRFLSEIPKDYVIDETYPKLSEFMKDTNEHFIPPKRPIKTPLYHNNHFKNNSHYIAKKKSLYNKSYKESIPIKKNAIMNKGSRVRHTQFGVGKIYQTEGTGDAQKITIVFEDNSIRKFVTKYAKLEPVSP